MTDIHIDDFYRDAAKIFLQLYLYFPQPAQLYVEDISGPDEPDEFGLHSKRHIACLSTMIWMAESGYLRYADTIRQEAIDQAVLTQKGFNLLTMRSSLAPRHPKASDPETPPALADEFSTNIYQIRQALKSGSSSQVREILQHLFSGG